MKKLCIVLLSFMLCGVVFAAPTDAEDAAIQYVIDSVKNAPAGTKFVRNGKAYDAPKAADHLRTKYWWAKKKLSTADEFIQYVASSSSKTDEPYEIIFPSGETVSAFDFFTEALKIYRAK